MDGRSGPIIISRDLFVKERGGFFKDLRDLYVLRAYTFALAAFDAVAKLAAAVLLLPAVHEVGTGMIAVDEQSIIDLHHTRNVYMHRGSPRSNSGMRCRVRLELRAAPRGIRPWLSAPLRSAA